jgi:uncharacterized protein
LSLYFDASVIVPTLGQATSSESVDAFLTASLETFLVSDFGAAEVASALSRLVRMRELDEQDATKRLATFDQWLALDITSVTTEAGDISAATSLVRRFELKLLTPDALHVVIAARLGASLVTRDGRMARAAIALGLPTVHLP